MNIKLKEALDIIKPLDENALNLSKKRWLSIVKPLFSLGKLEDIIIKIAGIKRKEFFSISKKCIVIMCSDNGVVEENVTQCGQDITSTVAKSFIEGKSTVCYMAKISNAKIIPIDIGMILDVDGITDKNKKIAYGTENIAKKPAMTRNQAISAIEVGINTAFEMKEIGYDIIGTGEMGIGNTTSSSAVISVLLNKPVELVTGKGAGLSNKGLEHKIDIIKRAIEINKPNINDPIDVLSKLGGFDIAGIVGLFIGGAAASIPVVIDGFISGVAAVIAKRICPECVSYMIASHISKEPAGRLILNELSLFPFIECDMCVGEGTGVAAVFPLLDMAYSVYSNMHTFDEWKHDAYKILE